MTLTKPTACFIVLCLVFQSYFSSAQYLFDPAIIHTAEINFYDADRGRTLDSLATLSARTESGTQQILAATFVDGFPIL